MKRILFSSKKSHNNNNFFSIDFSTILDKPNNITLEDVVGPPNVNIRMLSLSEQVCLAERCKKVSFATMSHPLVLRVLTGDERIGNKDK
jgi:hypothetical protein